jgi:RNA polymerase sigma-70 factor (ECF subfamily)
MWSEGRGAPPLDLLEPLWRKDGSYPGVDEPSSNQADVALVNAASAGDRCAQTAIWRRYLPLVRSRMSRSLGGQDVDDHVQEVFLRLFKYLPDLRDPAALRSFLIGIALRVAGTELRRRRSRCWLQLTASGDLPEPSCAAHVGADEPREAVARLSAILESFAPESYRVIELRYVEGKELSEVAEAIDVSLATAKRHLARASARLHAILRHEPSLADYVCATSLRGSHAERASVAQA